MAISGADIALQGILGAFGGAGKAVAENAENEIKLKGLQQLEEFKEALRTKTYKSQLDEQEKRTQAERDRRAQFYKDTEGASTNATYTDALGNEAEGKDAGGIIASKKMSRRELAEHRREEALKTGDEKLISQTYGEAKDIRAEEAAEDKRKADEAKATRDEKRLELLEKDAETRRRQQEANAKRTDALIAKALNVNGEKEPAKIREVKAIADMAFDGDVQKAVQFVYGIQDKPRTAAVMQMANILKDSNFGSDPKELMAEAERMVDELRSKEGATRGGVAVGQKNAPTASREPPKGDEPARPTTRAEFDKLPKGARYINPADGKTYIKK